MCMGATCPDCSKKTWRGCGRHIPSAMAGIPEDQWCSCDPKVEVDGKAYPRSAPSASWLSGLMGGGGEKKKKDEL